MPIPTLAISSCRSLRRSRSLLALPLTRSPGTAVGPGGERVSLPPSSPPDLLPYPLPLPVRQFFRVWWHHRFPPLRRTIVAPPKMPVLGMRRGAAQPSRGSQTAPVPNRSRGTATPRGGVPKARSAMESAMKKAAGATRRVGAGVARKLGIAAHNCVYQMIVIVAGGLAALQDLLGDPCSEPGGGLCAGSFPTGALVLRR